jgi:voltage-gated potassium channel
MLCISESKPFIPTFVNLLISAVTYQSPNLESGIILNDIIKGLSSLIGIFITGLVIGGISSVFIENHRKRRSGMSIPMLVDHVAICGWNESGNKIIKSLQEEDGHKDIVIICGRDKNPSSSDKVYWIKGDYTNQKDLEKAFIKDCKTAIVLADVEDSGGNQDYTDCRTVLSVLTIEKLNPEIHTAAELINPERKGHLEKAGVDEIVIRGEISGSMLSRISQNRGLSKVISRLLEFGEGSEFYKVDCPANINGQKFGEVLSRLYNEKSYLVIGFEKQNGQILISPPHDTVFDDSKYLYVIADDHPIL